MITTVTRPQSVSAESVQSIPIQLVDRHPQNRIVRPDDVTELAASIAEHGQREAVRLRKVGKRYQVLSGERRYQALKLNKAKHISAIVVECDDATALEEVALGNAQRKDLDPIERAELLVLLMRPTAEGGGGLDRLEAGKHFGLNSDSGVKNSVRLLRLPESIRTLIRQGELPERAARPLVPYAEAPAVMAAIERDFARMRKEKGQMYEWQETLEGLTTGETWWIEDLVRELTRPARLDVEESRGYNKPKQVRRFPVSDRDAELQIVTLPMRDKSRSERCLNVKLWDELNAPFEANLDAKGKDGKRAAAPTASQKVTPAQAKAEAKRRLAEAEERLNQFSLDWYRRLLRSTIAIEAEFGFIMTSLPWLVTRCTSDLERQAFPVATSATDGERIMRAFWTSLIWPVCDGPTKQRANRRMVAAGELPDSLPGFIDDKDLAKLASFTGVTLESAWKRGTLDGSDQRALVAVWLSRHTKEQLHALIEELGINEGDSICKRDELVAIVLKHHRAGKPLPVPKRLKGIKL